MTSLCFNAFNGSPWAGSPVPLRVQIAAAASAGYDLIGIDRFSLEAFEAAGGRIADVAGWLAADGIGCGSITGVAMLGVDPGEGAALSRARGWAEALDAPFVQINMGADGDAARRALDAACAAIAGSARLAIEYMPFTPLASIGDAVQLARGAGYERAGVLIDVWHHERGPDSPEALAATPVAAIAYVEFDDALPPGDDIGRDTMFHRTFPGEGVFDLESFVATIAATGYAGMVSVEILSGAWRGRDFAEFAARSYRASRPYWPGRQDER